MRTLFAYLNRSDPLISDIPEAEMRFVLTKFRSISLIIMGFMFELLSE